MAMLRDKKIILTGGGRGIGRVIAEQCAREGALISLFARTESELLETAARIRQYGDQSFTFVTDVQVQENVRDSVNKALQQMGGVDVLINNAGIQPPIGPFQNTDLQMWKTNIAVNLFGTIHCTHAVLPSMVEQKHGKIVNLSGGGATAPRPNFSAYAVSKTAIVRFTETLALELKAFSIDVNAVAPGAVNTNMLGEILSAKERAGTEYADAVRRRSAGGDDASLAAELICFLASDRSNGITGKLISARWDPWKDEAFQEALRGSASIGTLRRIDDKKFFERG